MKRIKELLFVILLMLPIFINAAMPRKYTESLSIAKDYIHKGAYIKSSSRYIDSVIPNPHFISSDEFKLSKGESQGSYLADGLEYWTSTVGENGNYYYITYNGQLTRSDNSSYKCDGRDTEYVKSDVKVYGSGTYTNPWRFDSIYEVTLKANTKAGYILENDTTYGSYTKYVSRNDSVKFGLKALTGQIYITDDCGGSFENGWLIIHGVKRNMTCNVIFGTGKYSVTLQGATPGVIYSKYQEGFYKDNNRKELIYELESVPSKAGYTFEGYMYKKEGTDVVIPVVSGKTIIKAAAASITENIVLSPTYSINNPSSSTISGGTTKVRNRSETTLTCTNNTTYASGTTMYYSFGSTDTEDGIPTNWSTESTSPTFSVNRDEFSGTYYYKCRVYAKYDGGQSEWVISSNSTAMTLVNARIDFDATTNGGTISGANIGYIKYNSTEMYSTRTGTSIINKPTASKSGYSFAGWFTAASGGTKVVNANGTLVSNVSGWTNSSGQWILTSTSDTAGTKTLYAQYTLSTPSIPTISGGSTKVYGHQRSTLTCSTTSYGSGVTVYYSFGYATSDGGSPGNWTTASASNTYAAPYAYGDRYYSCRVYASSGSTTTSTVTSSASADTKVTYVNARIDVDANGKTLTGDTTFYVAYGDSKIYTTRTGTTEATRVSSTHKGYIGLYSASTGTNQVVYKSGSLKKGVSNWTNDSNQWILTSTSNTANTNKLYAHYCTTIYIRYNANGGTLTSPYNNSLTLDNDGWLKNGSNFQEQSLAEGKRLDKDYGLMDYNNSSSMNIRKDGYKIKNCPKVSDDCDYTWNTKDDGSGHTFSQANTPDGGKAYHFDSLAPYTDTSCRVKLYADWVAN